tara:strand:- start:3 stop:281 length:279 start_codon:yes stop_codon:yes gene_type:complete
MVNVNDIVGEISRINPAALTADGLDAAIIGYGSQHGTDPVVIYDYDTCVEIFMKDNDWDYDGAIEWMEFNVVGSYVGTGTPIFMMRGEENND